MAVWLALYS